MKVDGLPLVLGATAIIAGIGIATGRSGGFNTKALSEAGREYLFGLARSAGSQADSMIRSGSGADQSDSERYYGRARVLGALGTGKDLETELARESARYRKYAEEKRRDVAASAKRGYGRVTHHRWVGIDTFDTQDAPFIRSVYELALQK